MAVTNWRQMWEADLPAVLAIQKEAYPWHQEERAVFEDRLRLWPQGCLTLHGDEEMIGYIVSHPWHADEPPPLDRVLGTLPERPGTYYLHDIALLKAAYGKGHGTRVVRHLAETAGSSGFETMSLIAVNKTAPFWQGQGFSPRTLPALDDKLKSYGEGAVYMTRALGE